MNPKSIRDLQQSIFETIKGKEYILEAYMKNILINIFTAQPFWTIISGVLVFAISQYLMEVWIKPLQEYKRIKRDIARLLTMNAPFYSNTLRLEKASEKQKDDYNRVSVETRAQAAELRAYIELVPLLHPGIPLKKKLYNASSELIGLSNGLYKSYGTCDMDGEKNNKESIEKLQKDLKLRR